MKEELFVVCVLDKSNGWLMYLEDDGTALVHDRERAALFTEDIASRVVNRFKCSSSEIAFIVRIHVNLYLI